MLLSLGYKAGECVIAGLRLYLAGYALPSPPPTHLCQPPGRHLDVLIIALFEEGYDSMASWEIDEIYTSLIFHITYSHY